MLYVAKLVILIELTVLLYYHFYGLTLDLDFVNICYFTYTIIELKLITYIIMYARD